jgi:hypothetical protein
MLCLQQLQAQQGEQAGSRPPYLSADEHLLFVWLRAQVLGDAAAAPAAAGNAIASGAAQPSSSSGSGGALQGAPGRAAACSSSSGSSGGGSSGGGSGRPRGTRAALLDQLGLRMPRQTREQLAAHEAW